MSVKVIGNCPSCKGKLTVTCLSCKSCNIDISGEFELNKFSYLTKDELEFVEIFLKCQGNLKDVQTTLGISYPTAKKQLDNVFLQLGYADSVIKEENIDIISKIDKGELSVKEAVELIKNNKKQFKKEK